LIVVSTGRRELTIQQWLPPNKAYQMCYAWAWVAVKLRCGLIDSAEVYALRSILGSEIEMLIMAGKCPGSINPFAAKLPVAEVDCSAKSTART
jgi:hypothetical protein